MSKIKICFVICALAFIVFSKSAYSQTVSSSELINNAKQHDGKTIVYQGEAIGDIMVRGKNAWINVHDGQNAVGVWVPLDLTREISQTGSYKFKGDILEISGIFHRACSEHGGDLDIHAQILRKINAGYPVKEKINPAKIKAVQIFAATLGLIWISILLKRL
jgi:hypothetical protein